MFAFLSVLALGIIAADTTTERKAAGVQTAPPATTVAPRAIARAKFIADMDGEFRKLDRDGNGAATRPELEAHLLARATNAAIAANRALFSRLDVDRNGTLSAAEFAKLASTSTPNVDVVGFLTRMDGNKDGKITLVEHRTATQANFDRLDVDKDGYVSATEMRAGGIVK